MNCVYAVPYPGASIVAKDACMCGVIEHRIPLISYNIVLTSIFVCVLRGTLVESIYDCRLG